MRLPVMMILSLIGLALLDDFGIWKLVKSRLREAGRIKWNLWWWFFCGLCYILLAFVICRPRRSENVDILSSMWMLYTFLSIYVAKTVALLCGLCGLIPKMFGKKRLNLLKWVGLPLGVLIFGTMWYGALVTRRQIEVKEVNYFSERIPEGFDGYRIVQLSDMHVGTWGNDTTFISRLVDSVLAQKPDLIVFTGDIVNRRTPELQPFLKTLTRLKASDGTLSILGNHDYGDYITWEHPSDRTENNALLAAWQKSMGWRLLNNEHLFLSKGNDSIVVIGVENWGEPPFHQYGRLDKAYSLSPDSTYNVSDSRFKILLSHNPEHWRQEVSRTTNIDLTLSGHTHAMQTVIRIGDWEWSPAVFKYEEWGGLYERLNNDGQPTSIYVNIGSGEVGMPFRIGAVPEVTVITLRRTLPEGTEATKPTKIMK